MVAFSFASLRIMRLQQAVTKLKSWSWEYWCFLLNFHCFCLSRWNSNHTFDSDKWCKWGETCFLVYSLLCRGNWPETIYNISTSHVTPKYRVPGIVESTSRIYITSRNVLCPFPLMVAMLHSTLNLCYDLIYMTNRVSEIFVQTVYVPSHFYGLFLFFSTSSWLCWMKNKEN